ncbi:hypothetical protein KSP39_PZI004898 [Platanthera zijinensis]|uniref:Uncharacterized protein n=1 Tax=Platanthera zijinensis TaxID=2320716 RepID=A0AAP0GC72_9ASPA
MILGQPLVNLIESYLEYTERILISIHQEMNSFKPERLMWNGDADPQRKTSFVFVRGQLTTYHIWYYLSLYLIYETYLMYISNDIYISRLQLSQPNLATISIFRLLFSQIFEGENNFLEYIMESSDMLYAAAASLDFNLQLFCSHMPETTDEIILNCIRTTGIIDRGLYSAMSESESIAESFLTRFPSLNPLSAHALLSCGGMLVEFLEWSHECRIQKIGNYKVPAESISLFNALCRYGELGESKSVMTDCSSIDSDNSGGILQPKSKRQRYGVSSHGPGMLMDESFYSEPSQLNRKSSGMLQPSHSNKSTFHEAPEKPQLFSNAETIYRKHDVNYLNRNDCVGDTRARVSHPHDRFSDDAIDYNCSFLDEACASASRRGFNLRRSELGCEPATEGFLSSSRLSDGHAGTFPSASEMNWVENALTNSSRSEESRGLKNAIFDEHLFAKRNYFVQQNHTDAHGQLKHANTVPSLGQFLRSKAREPSQQEGLPKQIIKSLGEANERRRAHQQSSCNTNPSFRCSLKRKATYQKKSPSIIDSFRYQGGTKQATDTTKKQNNFIRGRPSPQNLDKKDSPLIKPTWTPVDKRARQVTGAFFILLTLVRVVSIRFLGLKVVVDTHLHKGDDSPTGASYEVSFVSFQLHFYNPVWRIELPNRMTWRRGDGDFCRCCSPSFLAMTYDEVDV